MEKHIFIIRHGETDYNRAGIIQGRGVNISLNEEGRKQAKAFFLKYGRYPFDRVYTSSLVRSIETVQRFIDSGIPWSIRPELDEIDWGEQEGKETDKEMRELYRQVTAAWKSGALHVRIPGGESILDLAWRQKSFIESLRHDRAREILICSHGRAMRALLCQLLGMDLSRMDEFPHSNLSLYRLLQNEAGFHLVLRHDTSHLKLNPASF